MNAVAIFPSRNLPSVLRLIPANKKACVNISNGELDNGGGGGCGAYFNNLTFPKFIYSSTHVVDKNLSSSISLAASLAPVLH